MTDGFVVNRVGLMDREEKFGSGVKEWVETSDRRKLLVRDKARSRRTIKPSERQMTERESTEIKYLGFSFTH